MRRIVSVVAAAAVLVSLSACSATPSTLAACTSGGNAALVTASGAIGSDPTADFPTPLVAAKAEVAVLTKGDGADVSSTGSAEATVSIYDGQTGSPLQSQSGALTAVALRSFVTGQFPFTSAYSCAPVGSRIVVTGTASQLFGPQALGLDPSTTLVTVSDVTATFLGKANGADQLPAAGMPAVVLAPNGQPGFTFTLKTPPTELATSTLKAGSGATVAAGDKVAVNYSGIVWGGTAVFDSTWKNQAPAVIEAKPLASDGSGVVPGFAQAIIGQKVGSQVIVVIPPGADGFASGSAPTGVTDTSTLVYVIDILGIAK